MELKSDEKTLILKTFTNFLKSVNGKGPRNIYIKYFEDEIHIHMSGVVSDFEKYLIKNFGQEALDVFEDFYQRDCKNSEKTFGDMLNLNHQFQFKELITNFCDDEFVYKMTMTLR